MLILFMQGGGFQNLGKHADGIIDHSLRSRAWQISLHQFSHGIDKCIVSADFSQQTIITLLSHREWRAKSLSNYCNS
jgi:hypothetical protein